MSCRGLHSLLWTLVPAFAVAALGGKPITAQQKTYTHFEQFFDGTLLEGDHHSTHVDDGACESIQEIESGGKPDNRRSYLGHLWGFNVPAGSAQTFCVRAFLTDSGEGDDISFWWSVDDETYTHFLTYDVASSGTLLSAPLPPDIAGHLLIWMEDADRTRGHRVLDTFSIDWMYVETTPDDTPPAPPDQLVAEPLSSSAIELSWADNSSNEAGFHVERSLGGSPFETVGTVGADVTIYTDEELASATTYTYRVFAFNAHGVSPPSDTAAATTFAPSSFTLEMVRRGGTFPDHALDGSGEPIVAYSIGGALEFAWFNGLVWQHQLIDPVGPSLYSDPPHLIVSPFGQIGCAWSTPDKNVMFAERIHGAWLVEQVDRKNYWRKIDAAYDPDGNPCVVYDQSNSGRRGAGLLFARRIGGTWQIETVDGNGAWDTDKSLTFDLGGNPAVAYGVDLDGNTWAETLKLARRSGSGVWDPRIVEVAGSAMDPALAFHPISGLPAILHYDWAELRYLQWDGSMWQPHVPAVGSAPLGLVFDVIGQPHISYRAAGTSNNRPYARWYAVWDGVDWQHELVALEPWVYGSGHVVLDTQGRASIVFEGDLDGERGVILARQ